jgi:RNA recognition motif-containing protein
MASAPKRSAVGSGPSPLLPSPTRPGAAPHDGINPSKVIHIRSVPDGITEADIAASCNQFGQVVFVVLNAAKHMAFVEYANVDQAQDLMRQCSMDGIWVNGSQLRCNYSRNAEIFRPPIAAGQGREGPLPVHAGV